ncbi:MAG: hypothetical protein JNL08_20355 [Planctomycetes bacterium]|nr:hypothetical protein [Planctomycetota bacterium]
MTARRQPWWVWLLAWVGTLCGFGLVAHGNLESTDSVVTMHAARVLWQHGDSGLRREDQGGELLGERIAAELIPSRGALGKVGVDGRVYVWFPVGHVWLLAPLTGLGERLEAAFPDVDRRWREIAAPGADAAHLRFANGYVTSHPVLMQGLIALLLPPACAACGALLLFLLARTLGAAPRDAVLGTLTIALGTQWFAFGRETLSDGPGLCMLLAALLVAVRVHLGRASALLAVAGGLAAGAAVSLRYQNAVAVAVLLVVVALASRRTRNWRPVVAFALGGAPFLVALLASNHARFGDLFDTGYPKVADWYTQPLWLGLAKMLFAAGRGVMWLSPVLWLLLPLAAQRQRMPLLRGVAWVLFAVPFLFFAAAKGWQGGECWGARYVTPGVVVLAALALPQVQPWQRWPRTWTTLLAVGMFVNLTAVVAPVRGQVQLATQAAVAEALHAGRSLDADAAADVVSWHPRYSPLHSNWSYLVRSCVGGFEDEHGAPRHGSANTIEPLFGVAGLEPLFGANGETLPGRGYAPWRWEDRLGRHLWWRFWADLLQVPSWLLLLPLLAVAVLAGGIGWRRLAEASGSDPADAPIGA